MIDIGVNLASKRLIKNVPQIIQRGKEKGVQTLIITGSDPESNQKALELCHIFPDLYFTAGHHPHHANEWQPKNRLLIQSLAREKQCVAVGEMGLDYFRNLSTPTQQRQCFYDQLLLAKDAQKPVFLHERNAFTDFSALLKEALPELSGAIWHCFTGTRAQMEEMADLGVYFGITGWICDPVRGVELREVVRHIPQNRLMIETDAPYLTPKTLKPTPEINEPQYLIEVLKMVAQCRNENPEELKLIIRENTKSVFNL